MKTTLIIGLAALALTGCGTADTAGNGVAVDRLAYSAAAAPEGAAAGTCWGLDVTPAVIETVTEQVLVEAAELDGAGRVLRPAAYQTETRQAIVRQRQEQRFETPCRAVMDAEFIASLQRALAVRGGYTGSLTAMLDAPTRQAIRAYQSDNGGPDSDILSLAAARQLGLVAVPREG